MTATIDTATRIDFREAEPLTKTPGLNTQPPRRASRGTATFAAVAGVILIAAIVASLFIG